MTTVMPTAKLADVAEMNPPLPVALGATDEVSFMPMSAVDAESVSAVDRETRLYSEVSKGYTPFADGDVLVAKITPCFENGKIAQVHLRRRYGFGSTEFHVVRPHADRAVARYLVHFLRQDRIRQQGESRMTGSAGQRRVPENFLAGLSVPLPPLPEQLRIAEILDKADTLRAKRRAALGQIDTLTQSIFLDMFGDPIANPHAWPKKKLTTLGSLDRGVSQHRPRNAPELLGGPYPFVQTGDVANCDGYIRTYTATYSEIGLRQSKLWPAGTLCITIAANIAKTGILTFDACFPDSVVGFGSDDPATVEFVRGWLSFLQASIEARAPESAQKNINLEILRGLDVPSPSADLRIEFARRIAAAESLKTVSRRALSRHGELFAALQYRAFKGAL